MAIQFKKHQVVNLSMIMLAFGLIVMIVGFMTDGLSVLNFNFPSLLTNLGAYVAVIIALEFVYDSWVREQFHKDIFNNIVKAEGVQNSGIEEFYADCKRYDYTDLIKSSAEVKLFFVASARVIKDYVDTWEGRVAAGKPAKIHYIADTGNAASYFEKYDEDGDIQTDLKQIKKDLKHIDPDGKFIAIARHDFILSYDIYKFDDLILIAFNATTRHKAPVPLLVLKKETPLYHFVAKDLERMEKTG